MHQTFLKNIIFTVILLLAISFIFVFIRLNIVIPAHTSFNPKVLQFIENDIFDIPEDAEITSREGRPISIYQTAFFYLDTSAGQIPTILDYTYPRDDLKTVNVILRVDFEKYNEESGYNDLPFQSRPAPLEYFRSRIGSEWLNSVKRLSNDLRTKETIDETIEQITNSQIPFHNRKSPIMKFENQQDGLYKLVVSKNFNSIIWDFNGKELPRELSKDFRRMYPVSFIPSGILNFYYPGQFLFGLPYPGEGITAKGLGNLWMNFWLPVLTGILAWNILTRRFTKLMSANSFKVVIISFVLSLILWPFYNYLLFFASFGFREVGLVAARILMHIILIILLIKNLKFFSKKETEIHP